MNQPYPSSSSSSAGVAALIEVCGGLFLQVFGLGHIYAGRIMRGLIIMFIYWLLQVINFVLCFALVGFLTAGLTWLAFLIISPIWASNSVRR